MEDGIILICKHCKEKDEYIINKEKQYFVCNYCWKCNYLKNKLNTCKISQNKVKSFAELEKII